MLHAVRKTSKTEEDETNKGHMPNSCSEFNPSLMGQEYYANGGPSCGTVGLGKGVPLTNSVKAPGREQGGTDLPKIQMVVEIILNALCILNGLCFRKGPHHQPSPRLLQRHPLFWGQRQLPRAQLGPDPTPAPKIKSSLLSTASRFKLYTWNSGFHLHDSTKFSRVFTTMTHSLVLYTLSHPSLGPPLANHSLREEFLTLV